MLISHFRYVGHVDPMKQQQQGGGGPLHRSGDVVSLLARRPEPAEGGAARFRWVSRPPWRNGTESQDGREISLADCGA